MDLRASGSNAVVALTVGLQTPTLLKEWEVCAPVCYFGAAVDHLFTCQYVPTTMIEAPETCGACIAGVSETA